MRRFSDAHTQGTGAELRIGFLQLAETGLYPGDEHPGFHWLGHRKDDEELVATQAPHHVEGTALPAKDLTNLDEQAVAGCMAHGVVHDLEPVQIEQKHAGVELMPQA